jgi:hypothetical protein
VSVARERLRRSLVASSSCGVCGKVTVDSIRITCPPISCDAVVPATFLPRMSAAMSAAQTTFDRTGGSTPPGSSTWRAASGAARGHRPPQRGGQGRRSHAPEPPPALERHVLMVSGRASFEVMQKAWDGAHPDRGRGVGPSSMAAQMAVSAGMTLVGSCGATASTSMPARSAWPAALGARLMPIHSPGQSRAEHRGQGGLTHARGHPPGFPEGRGRGSGPPPASRHSASISRPRSR